jgi:hypothetical protein
MRRVLLGVVVSIATLSAVLVEAAPAASAGTTVALLLPQSTAFSFVGHSCGGIQEKAYARGFDPATGYPTGDVYMQTSCGGSGRGGGYHTTVYSAWAAVTWDFTGATVSASVLTTAPTDIDPSLDTYDSYGNEVYNASSNAYLVLAATFTPLPRIVGISPASGSAAGGTTVVITGTGFTSASAVDFGGNAAASYSVADDTTITAVSPAASAGTVDLTVTNAGGASLPETVDRFTFIPVPSVSQLTPARGPVGGGTAVTITGTGLTGATTVMFGETATSFTVDSDTSITAVAPATEAPDTATVRVVTPGGTSAVAAADRFTYLPAPTVTSFTPHAGAVGTVVTITGTHLSGATRVTFGGRPALFFADSGTKISAKVPTGAKTGRIRVTTAGGTAVSSAPFTLT